MEFLTGQAIRVEAVNFWLLKGDVKAERLVKPHS